MPRKTARSVGQTRWTESPTEWIVSGPHVFVGNLFFKTPTRVCQTKGQYTRLDLTTPA